MSPLLCDPIWHISFRSGEACCELRYSVTLPTLWHAGSRSSAGAYSTILLYLALLYSDHFYPRDAVMLVRQ